MKKYINNLIILVILAFICFFCRANILFAKPKVPAKKNSVVQPKSVPASSKTPEKKPAAKPQIVANDEIDEDMDEEDDNGNNKVYSAEVSTPKTIKVSKPSAANNEEEDDDDEEIKEDDEDLAENDEVDEESEPKEDSEQIENQLTTLLNAKKQDWTAIKNLADKYSKSKNPDNTILNYAFGMYYMNAKTKNYTKALNNLTIAKNGRNAKYKKLASSAHITCLIKKYGMLVGILAVFILILLIIVIKKAKGDKKTVRIDLNTPVESQQKDVNNIESPLQQDEQLVISKSEVEKISSASENVLNNKVEDENKQNFEQTDNKQNYSDDVNIQDVIEENNIEQSINNDIQYEDANTGFDNLNNESKTDTSETQDDDSYESGSYESPEEAARRIEAELKIKRAAIEADLSETSQNQTNNSEQNLSLNEPKPASSSQPFKPSFGPTEKETSYLKIAEQKIEYNEADRLEDELKEQSVDSAKFSQNSIYSNSSHDYSNQNLTVFEREAQIKQNRENVAEMMQPKREETLENTALDDVWDNLSKKALKQHVEPMIGTTILPETTDVSNNIEQKLDAENENKEVDSKPKYDIEDLSVDLSEESMREDLVGKLKMLAISDGELRELMSQRNPAHIPHLIEYIMTRPEPVRLAFVARELGHYKDEAVVDVLGNLLHHNDERVVMAAIQGLENTEMLSSILLLCSLVRDNNPLLAQASRASLSRFGVVKLMNALEGLPDYPDDKIKESGIFVLSRMKGIAVEELLKKMLKDQSLEVRCQAILAMSFQKNPVYVETLREFFRNATDKDKSLARKAIVYLQSFAH